MSATILIAFAAGLIVGGFVREGVRWGFAQFDAPAKSEGGLHETLPGVGMIRECPACGPSKPKRATDTGPKNASSCTVPTFRAGFLQQCCLICGYRWQRLAHNKVDEEVPSPHVGGYRDGVKP